MTWWVVRATESIHYRSDYRQEWRVRVDEAEDHDEAQAEVTEILDYAWDPTYAEAVEADSADEAQRLFLDVHPSVAAKLKRQRS